MKLAQACFPSNTEEEKADATCKYKSSVVVFAGSIFNSSERANDEPTDNDRKRVATNLKPSASKCLSWLGRQERFQNLRWT